MLGLGFWVGVVCGESHGVQSVGLEGVFLLV